ncbi:MetQ/NlpA family ABC transporter substrate-binding protein [Basilea psittacipulmonis]|uniref:MetQ/NlpA family ABC transporter substrate-binding protein n=1 Tax=Basilea psittacipulmonis TaxID=1472345 RepID=UPI00068BBA9D|nr:MetQ/NlpA family ABC transporter substrate-binding protein [Basilea psittacipulmonis]
MKLLKKFFLATALATLIVPVSQAKDPNKDLIIFGATVGDHVDLFKKAVKPVLEKEGYQVKVVEFTDYVRPNKALASGDIDINAFQHKPYLNAFKAANQLDIIDVFSTPNAPLGLYAGKFHQLDEVKDGASVAIPNDPSNGARALILLQDLGWITLKPEIDPLRASVKDIDANPKHLKIIELEAAQIPRARNSVDFAVITGNYATSSGLKITEALFTEQSDAFTNIAAVRSEDANKEWVKDVENAYNAQSVKEWAYKHFPGYRYPAAWSK